MKNKKKFKSTLFFFVLNIILVGTIVFTIQNVPFIGAVTFKFDSEENREEITISSEETVLDNTNSVKINEQDEQDFVLDESEIIVKENDCFLGHYFSETTDIFDESDSVYPDQTENNKDNQSNEADYQFTFTGVDGGSIATITGYVGEARDIVLPETATNSSAGWNIPSPVRVIGTSAFNNKQLTSVIIGNNIEVIGNNAFQRNSLTSIVLPDSITTLGSESFQINNLTHVTIGNNITVISPSAFLNNQIEEVIIGNSVVTIESRAFQTNKLNEIHIPDSVVTISASAFYGNQLSELMIPDSVVSLGNSCFSNNNLTNVEVGNGINFVGSQVFAKSPLKTLKVSSEKIEQMKNLFVSSSMNGVSERTILETIDGVVEYSTDTLNEYRVNTVGRNINLNINVPKRYQLGTLNSHLWVEAVPKIEWFKNSVSTGLKASTLTLANVSKSDEGSYYVIVDGTQLPPVEVYIEDYQFNFTGTSDDSTALIIGYLGKEVDIELPSIATNYEDNWRVQSTVTAIGECAFLDKKLKSVSIPDTINILGEKAFQGNLISQISFPDSLIKIGESSFFGNPLEAIYVSWEHLDRYKDILSEKNSMAGISVNKTVLLTEYDFSYLEGTQEEYILNEGDNLTLGIEGKAYETYNDGEISAKWSEFPTNWMQDNTFLENSRNLELNKVTDPNSGIYRIVIGDGNFVTELPEIEITVIPRQDNAVPDTNPENPSLDIIDVNPNIGALSIRYVSNISFGQIEFSKKPQDFRSNKLLDKDGKEMPHMITIQDARERKVRNGWVLTVKQNRNVIEGSELYINPYVNVENSKKFGVSLYMSQLLLNIDSQVVASVKGDGNSYSPGVFSIGLSGSGTDGVRLSLPSGISVGVGRYQATLTWVLLDGP